MQPAGANDRRVEGIGIGFRYAIARRTLECDVPEIRWLELHPENYVQRGGRFRHVLEQARERWPLVTHGLSMGFGAVEPAEDAYMRPLRAFLHELGVPWHSEHLCFSGADGVMLHDLMPLPRTREGVRTAVARIRETRDRLELPIALENISYYADTGPSEMTEVDFLLEVLEGADAKLLLDVNNVFVNSQEPRLRCARATSIACRRSAWCRSTSPATTCASDRADHRHARRAGARRGVRLARAHACAASARCRCCSSATRTSRRSRSWWPRCGGSTRSTGGRRKSTRSAMALVDLQRDVVELCFGPEPSAEQCAAPRRRAHLAHLPRVDPQSPARRAEGRVQAHRRPRRAMRSSARSRSS